MKPNGKGVVVTGDLHLCPLLTLERTKGLQLLQTPAQTQEGSLRLQDTSKPTLTQPITTMVTAHTMIIAQTMTTAHTMITIHTPAMTMAAAPVRMISTSSLGCPSSSVGLPASFLL